MKKCQVMVEAVITFVIHTYIEANGISIYWATKMNEY